tara:strand:- start:452 stop:742 length:291 start_codon:yes stop_codon:yes gene_type:complete
MADAKQTNKYINVVGYFWFPILALFKDSLDPSFGILVLSILLWFYVVGFDLLNDKEDTSPIGLILLAGRFVAYFVLLLVALKIVVNTLVGIGNILS